MGISKDCPIFYGTPIISRTDKATKFKFCTHIYWLNLNKSPLKISGKVAVGVVRDSRKFSGQPYRRRGHLCDSSAFLFVNEFVIFSFLTNLRFHFL